MLRQWLASKRPTKSGETQTPPALPREQLAHFPRERLPDVAAPNVKGWPFPAHLDNPNCKWLQALKHVYAQPITFPASLSPQAGQLLHALVLNTQPRVIVETGMFLGISTIWMAGALELRAGEGMVHSIDDFRPIRKGHWRDEEMPEAGDRERRVRAHIALAGLEHRVCIHPGNSAAGVAALAAALRPQSKSVQFAFLDADHTPGGVRAEFEALEPILDTGGYVILHDIYPEICNWRGPRRLLDEVHTFAKGRYEMVDLYLAPANFGMGVMRRIA